MPAPIVDTGSGIKLPQTCKKVIKKSPEHWKYELVDSELLWYSNHHRIRSGVPLCRKNNTRLGQRTWHKVRLPLTLQSGR